MPPPTFFAMIRESYSLALALGRANLGALVLLAGAFEIAWVLIGDAAFVVEIALGIFLGHAIYRALLTGAPLQMPLRQGGALPHLGRYAAAWAMVMGLCLLAMLPLVVPGLWLVFSGYAVLEEATLVLLPAFGLPLLAVFSLIGTAMPAAALGRPYGLRAALDLSRGQRGAIALALLAGPGLVTLVEVVPTLIWPTETGYGLLIAVPLRLVSLLSMLLTCAVLSIAYQRATANPADVFA